MTQYHVSAQAAKTNGAGSAADPFLTIGQAAAIARAGDEVVVHAGTYRESVDPRFGGESATNRIVYRAAAGEPRPVITGSERIDTWQPEGDGVWKAVIPNAFFNGYNPYVETVFGDWTVYPDPKVEVRHLGDVYLNGKSFYEVASLDKVRNPQRWDTGRDAATDSIVPLIDPDATVNVWCCAVDDEATTIWANFHEADPNAELTEINVRETCFYPSRPFVNYITVSGFEMAQAACPYTPPTADQVGLVGPHWSRGWVIENNRIHDAKCSAISLGKEISTGDNESTRTHRKSGYQYQKEAVYKALHAGWEKGVVGGHVVRGNVIYDCGQNGVVGHMGCAFSLIEEAGLGDEELYRSVKQPVLLASNAYVSGAKAASGEAEAVVSGDGSSLALRETDDELWMTVSLPESIRSATGPVISTADLGQPRIVEEYFENPDGSPIVVDRDITGAARGACSARGPLAAYGDGEVLIWSK